jgi:hypothetical protein
LAPIGVKLDESWFAVGKSNVRFNGTPGQLFHRSFALDSSTQQQQANGQSDGDRHEDNLLKPAQRPGLRATGHQSCASEFTLAAPSRQRD